MEFSKFAKYLNDLNLPAEYSIDTDKSRGGEIAGFDQLTIRWSDNEIDKFVNIFLRHQIGILRNG